MTDCDTSDSHEMHQHDIQGTYVITSCSVGVLRQLSGLALPFRSRGGTTHQQNVSIRGKLCSASAQQSQCCGWVRVGRCRCGVSLDQSVVNANAQQQNKQRNNTTVGLTGPCGESWYDLPRASVAACSSPVRGTARPRLASVLQETLTKCRARSRTLHENQQ